MKAYLKPVLYYERFELSQHIASCDLKVSFNLGGGKGCNASGTLWGATIEHGFIVGDSDCQIPYDGYCYTGGAEIGNTFAS